MKEDDIRPRALVEEQARLYANDIARMMSKKDGFFLRPCPACDSKASTPSYSKHEMSYVECSDCQTTFANPAPTAEILQEYYRNSENYKFWTSTIFPLTEDVRRESIFMPRADALFSICEEYGQSLGALVEIGPGFGTFCEEIIKRDLFEQVLAIEPTPELAQTLREKGIEVIEKFIEEITEQAIADVVVAFEVIEHMLEPRRFLDVIFNMLRPDGLLMLTAPNGHGFDTLVLQEKAPAVDVEHLTLFTPNSLKSLLEKIGFEVLLIDTPGTLDADIVRNRLMNDEALRQSHPFLVHLLLEREDTMALKLQSFLTKEGLSGNLRAIARKKPSLNIS